MIGIFDSGSGGLTVLKALRGVLPSADVVYFGDIKNAPYGERPQEELSLLTVGAIQLLRKRGATKIISACNSAASSLALSVCEAFGLEPTDIVEMVGPTVASLRSTDNILLCATPATVRSGIYQNAFHMVGKEIKVLPIPGLAGAIEFGQPEEQIIADAFKDAPPFDVLVLACTHYPLVLESFKKALPHKVIFDPAATIAERAHRLFWPQEVRDGKTTFCISKESPQFRALVAKLFPDTTYTVEVIE